MNPSFHNKSILITGAGSGIGRATAVKLARLGAKLAITDLDLAAIETTYKLCGGESHHYGVMDVRDREDVEYRVREIISSFSHLDHVFNCAGVNPTSYPLADVPDGHWERLMDTNLKGLFLVTRATMPHMRAGGSYVNVSSICGLHPVANMAIYCASKFGVIGFSKSMALELGPRGVRVNVVAPGYIDTPTNAGVVQGGEAVEKMEHASAAGRLGRPEEVAEVVVFLMSEGASFMNGSVVEADGGLKGMVHG